MRELEPYQRELIAEYKQLDKHYDKLRDAKYKAIGAEKQFRANVDKSLISSQLQSMNDYLGDLAARISDEGIEQEADEFDYPGDISDGYHTFNELYRYRMLYNAAFLNMYSDPSIKRMPDGKDSIVVRNVGKSRLHHDGTEPFGGGWFIVWFGAPNGAVISNHYELKYWELFNIPEYSTAPEWDGSTSEQQADLLEQWLTSGH